MTNRQLLFAHPYGKVLLVNNQRKRHIMAVQPQDTRSPKYIITVVSEYLKVSAADMVSLTRRHKIVEARQIAMFLIKHNSKRSLKEIGKIFGRDHSTVIYAINCIYDRRFSDKVFKETLQDITKRI